MWIEKISFIVGKIKYLVIVLLLLIQINCESRGEEKIPNEIRTVRNNLKISPEGLLKLLYVGMQEDSLWRIFNANGITKYSLNMIGMREDTIKSYGKIKIISYNSDLYVFPLNDSLNLVFELEKNSELKEKSRLYQYCIVNGIVNFSNYIEKTKKCINWK